MTGARAGDDSMRERYEARYPGHRAVGIEYCPYRVCPLGAHVDHQGGLVAGFALDRGVRIAYEPTEDGGVHLLSEDFEGHAEFRIGEIPPKRGDWADPFRGAALALGAARPLRRGVRALIAGELPIGGLSSSAAANVAFLRALAAANGRSLTGAETVDAALRAENEYVGVSVGLLDPSCVVYGARDRLLLLDTSDRSRERIPMHPSAPPLRFAIAYAGASRTLAGTAYNARVDEAKAAAYALMGYEGAPCGGFREARLRSVPVEAYERHRDKLPEPWRKRAEHYYSEQRRVIAGAAAWREGDLAEFGRLTTRSGDSSIMNYETGSRELIALHRIFGETAGVYGGRFSGAGFKGCYMAIVDPSREAEIAERARREYLREFPEYRGAFSIRFCDSADGCGPTGTE